MFRSGYVLLGRWRGAPIKLHLSILLGLLLLSGFRWAPGFFVAYPCLILLHELGHAALVRRSGHRVLSVEVTGFGGTCQWSGSASPFEAALIACGGVLAQLLLFGATELWLSAHSPSSAFGRQVASTFTRTNLWLIAFNLLPIPPLDGARAWGIFRTSHRRGPGHLPHGSWRDPGPVAQRAWFDKLRVDRPARSRAAADLDTEPEGPLSAEAQEALDRLLESVTGKGKTRHSERGD